MARNPRPIVLTDSERASLEKMIQPTMQYRYVQRAKVILLAAEHRTNDEIIAASGLSEVAVCQWKKRFVDKRIDGLRDLPRSGSPTKYTHRDVLKIINKACSRPKEDARWTVRSLAEGSGTGMYGATDYTTKTIVLASEDWDVFFHELGHAIHRSFEPKSDQG